MKKKAYRTRGQKDKSKIIKNPEEKKKLFGFLNDEEKKHSPNGKLTFIGVFDKYFDEIAIRWKAMERTLIPYSNDYVKTVLPKLEESIKEAYESAPERYTANDLMLPITEYSGDIFLSALEKIRAANGSVLSKEQKDHYLLLYRKIIEVASEHGECTNYLYGTQRTKKEKPAKEKETSKTLLPKSLSPLMNAIIFYALTSAPEKMDGQWVGLFLMYAFGLRDNESVGIQFKDLDSVRGYDILWVYSTAAGRNTTAQKAKGKTINAYRGIIACAIAVEVIFTRRVFIEAHVKSLHPDWDDEKIKAEVDEYPIACHGNDYDKWITPSDLTDAGRDLFSRIHCADFDEDEFYLAFRASLDEDHNSITGFAYKNPTAYLFRREFGTVLKILQFDKNEREFLMGHMIEERTFSRNDYLNSPRLAEMNNKMKQRPLFNPLKKHPIVVTSDDTVYEHVIMPNDTLRIQQDSAKHILVTVKAMEPFDDRFTVSPHVTALLDSEFINRNNHEPANVISVYQNVMKRAYDSLDEKKIKALIDLPWAQ